MKYVLAMTLVLLSASVHAEVLKIRCALSSEKVGADTSVLSTKFDTKDPQRTIILGKVGAYQISTTNISVFAIILTDDQGNSMHINSREGRYVGFFNENVNNGTFVGGNCELSKAE